MGSCPEEKFIVECIVSKGLVKTLAQRLNSEQTSMAELQAFMGNCTDIYSQLPIEKFEKFFSELEGEVSDSLNIGDRYPSMGVIPRASLKFAKVSYQTNIIDK
jgi:hypothetical protein